jgi:demethylmenaquinone methyltransferase/2-methoxy-6-polyprenyl-1,4-benzoquinol methylase
MTARGSALPRDDQKARAVRDMFDAIAPRYDLVNRIMTFGIDGLWRARAVRDLALPIGSTVVDIGCGTGDLCRALHAERLHGIGVDMSWNMLVHARTGAPLVEADGLQLPFPDESLDGAVSGFALRNLTDLAALFHELARVLRPLGRIALLDVAQPTQPLLRWGHGMYFGKVVPMIGAALSDAAAYRYLPESVAYLPAADRMVAMLDEAGFERVERRLLTGGITQLLTGTKACP